MSFDNVNDITIKNGLSKPRWRCIMMHDDIMTIIWRIFFNSSHWPSTFSQSSPESIENTTTITLKYIRVVQFTFKNYKIAYHVEKEAASQMDQGSGCHQICQHKPHNNPMSTSCRWLYWTRTPWQNSSYHSFLILPRYSPIQ